MKKTYDDIIKEHPEIDAAFHWHDYELYKLTIMSAYALGKVVGTEEQAEASRRCMDKFIENLAKEVIKNETDRTSNSDNGHQKDGS